MAKRLYGYTLTEHSARARGHPDFAKAVMATGLETSFERARALRVGGVVVESYMEADDLADKVNYPPEVEGLIPQFRGTFSTERINGYAIAIPVREIVP